MSVSRIVTVDLGGASLAADNYLGFALYARPGNPIWNFGCLHRATIIAVRDTPSPAYKWSLGHGIPGFPTYPFDTLPGVVDRYVLSMSFAGTPGYRYVVVQQPQGRIILDVSYNGTDPTDVFREVLDVTLL
jgi:hypothetical protein